MKWEQQFYSLNPAKYMYLSRYFNVDPLIIQMLHSRGFRKKELMSSFFFPSIRQLNDPFLLNDMARAIKRTIKAIKNHETIVIFGDYDMDGITSSTIMTKLIRFFHGTAIPILPLRERGYGISVSYIEEIHDIHHPSLIITVDNGSNAHEALKKAEDLGIDVIVTDHHEILEGHPHCLAFINPKRSDSTYPFDGLSGAGVAFKFAQALFSTSKFSWEQHCWQFMELAALGTIADVMPLTTENRVICSLGLKKLNTNPSDVFKHLFILLKLSVVSSETIGFQIAPIFNSIGRISDPNMAVSVFLNEIDDLDNALRLLIQTNEKRKEMTFFQTQTAEEIIFKNQLYSDNILVIQGPFHEGLIGIISARITDKYKKPSILITENGKGSARSIGTFSIVRAIEQCGSYLKTFGGHQAAAGLSIDPSLVEDFRHAIQSSATKQLFIESACTYDAEIPINFFPPHLLEDFLSMEPFGEGNPRPLFYSPNTWVDHISFFGKENHHAKLHIQDTEAYLFMKGKNLSHPFQDMFMDLLYSIKEKNQFIILDHRTHLVLPKISGI